MLTSFSRNSAFVAGVRGGEGGCDQAGGVGEGERVRRGGPADLVGRLELRGVDDPTERPRRLVDQAGALGDLDPGRAEQFLGLAALGRGGEMVVVALALVQRVFGEGNGHDQAHHVAPYHAL